MYFQFQRPDFEFLLLQKLKQFRDEDLRLLGRQVPERAVKRDVLLRAFRFPGRKVCREIDFPESLRISQVFFEKLQDFLRVSQEISKEIFHD